MFSLIWNKISHKHVAYENRPFLITEKFAQQAKHIHSNRQSTMTKQTRMIWIVAFAFGNSLLCSTTSGTLPQLCFGTLIEKLRYLWSDFLPIFCNL
jgi:hypothetical protein